MLPSSERVIIVDRLGPVWVRPAPAVPVLILRGVLELLLGNSYPLSSDSGVVVQAVPGERIVVAAMPRNPPKLRTAYATRPLVFSIMTRSIAPIS